MTGMNQLPGEQRVGVELLGAYPVTAVVAGLM